jgi:hypothetical protein
MLLEAALPHTSPTPEIGDCGSRPARQRRLREWLHAGMKSDAGGSYVWTSSFRPGANRHGRACLSVARLSWEKRTLSLSFLLSLTRSISPLQLRTHLLSHCDFLSDSSTSSISPESANRSRMTVRPLQHPSPPSLSHEIPRLADDRPAVSISPSNSRTCHAMASGALCRPRPEKIQISWTRFRIPLEEYCSIAYSPLCLLYACGCFR